MNLRRLVYTAGFLFSSTSFANVCGTDFQNFNPTTNGLDFVTVQSSETLKPCTINMGLFFNYAKNTLTYTKSSTNLQKGDEAKDSVLAADLSVGFGITDRWDVGINIPFVLYQKIEDDFYVYSYKEKGATEIKINTKYHLSGDESGGTAVVVSMNQNLIKNNPFAGSGAGPTWNFEFVKDTTINAKWAVAVNGGYRLRDKGDQIPGAPFAPMGDQWIYSTAASYLMANLDAKLIGEIYGSRAANRTDGDTDRALNTLEALLGVKYDTSTNMAVHFGAATQLDSDLGGPDWRVYAGLNWAIDTNCASSSSTTDEPDVTRVKINLLFKSDSDEVDEFKLGDLDQVMKSATSTKYQRIVVEGHTDSVGVEAYNLDLSQRRANGVRAFLIERYKIPKDKIQAIGYGQTRPIADNGNFQGRQKNRRVELNFFRK